MGVAVGGTSCPHSRSLGARCRYKEKGWAYHEGHESDRRMKAAAAKRGVCLTSLSRPLWPEDLHTFDYILGMVRAC